MTGASSGIGMAIALNLLKEGALVCLIGRSLQRLKAIEEKIITKPNQVRYYQADFEEDNDVSTLVRNIMSEFDGLDILVHSAGIISMGIMEKATIDDFDRQYRINVRAPYMITQSLLPLLKAKKGQIIFINSSAVLSSRAETGQYAATKHALKAVADSLREEVNEDGIRVLSIYPGRTASPMQEYIFKTEHRLYDPTRLLQPDDISKVVLATLKLPRTAEVTEIMVRPIKKINCI